MGMIRRADLETYTRDAVVMNLGDLKAQGKATVDAATQHAEQVLKDAQNERDRLISGAAEKGREEGYREGYAKGLEAGRAEGFAKAIKEHTEQIAALTQQWNESLGVFSQERDAMYQQARRDVIELAALIAERVTKRAIVLDPAIVETQMRTVLDTLARPTGLVLRVHPEDLAYAETVLPGLIADCTNCTSAEVVADDSLSRGSCIAETDGRGVIDATIGTQLDRIVEAILPGHVAQSPEAQEPETDVQGDAA